MEFTWKDKSNYFKGLLLLIGKDFIISPEERQLLTSVGKKLGFAKSFIEDSINNLLDNKFIIDEPPEFGNEIIAKSFIKDGILLAMSDNEIHPSELEWLKEVVNNNNISSDWFNNELKHIIATEDKSKLDEHLQLNKLLEDNLLNVK